MMLSGSVAFAHAMELEAFPKSTLSMADKHDGILVLVHDDLGDPDPADNLPHHDGDCHADQVAAPTKSLRASGLFPAATALHGDVGRTHPRATADPDRRPPRA